MQSAVCLTKTTFFTTNVAYFFTGSPMVSVHTSYIVYLSFLPLVIMAKCRLQFATWQRVHSFSFHSADQGGINLHRRTLFPSFA